MLSCCCCSCCCSCCCRCYLVADSVVSRVSWGYLARSGFQRGFLVLLFLASLSGAVASGFWCPLPSPPWPSFLVSGVPPGAVVFLFLVFDAPAGPPSHRGRRFWFRVSGSPPGAVVSGFWFLKPSPSAPGPSLLASRLLCAPPPPLKRFAARPKQEERPDQSAAAIF